MIDLAGQPARNADDARLVLLGLACALRFEARALVHIERITSELVDLSGTDGGPEPSLIPLIARRLLPATSSASNALLKLASDPGNASSVSAWAARQLQRNSAGDSLPSLPAWVQLLSDDTFAYTAPPELIRRIATDVGAMTLFGTRPAPPAPALTKHLAAVLRFWLFCCQKDDDLDLYCPLQRALTFLVPGQMSDDSVAWVLRHQRPDGRFSAQELSLAIYRRGQPGFDLAGDAYLPLTVASVWTLASMS